MSSTGTRRRRRGQHPTPTRTPIPQTAPERGATLNLQDPTSFINWLTSNAEGFQANAKQNREDAGLLWTAAAEHDRNIQAADVRIAELQAKVDELRAAREGELQKKEMRAAEAKQLDDRAQNSENAAADIQSSIPVIQQAVANGSGQSPTTTAIDLDPKDAARIDGAISRIDALRAELPADQRDEGEL